MPAPYAQSTPGIAEAAVSEKHETGLHTHAEELDQDVLNAATVQLQQGQEGPRQR